MTLTYVRDQLRRIEASRNDPEVAHSLQDDLFALVLREAAAGAHNSAALAAEALKAQTIEFPRHMA